MDWVSVAASAAAYLKALFDLEWLSTRFLSREVPNLLSRECECSLA
jgi:hypothetical protein